MNNPRITPRDRNAIKGAIRRAFSRSELRQAVIDASIIQGYSDPSRPRVKTWCRCNVCKLPEARSYMAVDHVLPVIPVSTTFEAMSIDTVVDRMWCEKNNLQAICPNCHDQKTALERKERQAHKKRSKK